jgi:hypothetical protein
VTCRGYIWWYLCAAEFPQAYRFVLLIQQTLKLYQFWGLASLPIWLSMSWPYYWQFSRIKHLWVRSSWISELVVLLMLVSSSGLTTSEDVDSKHLLKKGCACARCREASISSHWRPWSRTCTRMAQHQATPTTSCWQCWPLDPYL